MDYYNKLFNISSNTTVAPECFNIFKRLALKSQDEENNLILLKYLGRIWIQHDFPLEANDEPLVIFYSVTYYASINLPIV